MSFESEYTRMNSKEQSLVKRWVDIVSFNAEKEERHIVAHCVFDGTGVHCEGEEGVLESLSQGITRPDGVVVTPKDGEAFLAALCTEFRSAYLFATEIQEEPIAGAQEKK